MKMKGQINVQYIIALAVFIGIIWFLTFQVTRTIPEFKMESEKNILNSKAYRLTELMVKSEGAPKNWTLSNVESIGLVKSENVLNTSKVNEFENMCNNKYDNLRDIFQSSNNDNTLSDFHVTIENINNDRVDCGRRIPDTASVSVVSIKRRVIYRGFRGTLELIVW